MPFFHFAKDKERGRGKPFKISSHLKCEICGKPQDTLHELREHKRKLVKDGGHAY